MPSKRKRRTVGTTNEMGLFFYGRGAYDLAVSELKLALLTAPFPIGILHINLGAAYLAKNMEAEAEASLRRGLTMEPRSQTGQALLGRLLRRTGRGREALEVFERARDLDPDSSEGQNAAEEIRQLKGREPIP